MANERDLYATRVVGGDQEDAVMKLVLVEASDEEDARRESGLVDFDFHRATEAELAEWDETTAGALTTREIEMLLYLVSRQMREIGRKRKKSLDPQSPGVSVTLAREDAAALLAELDAGRPAVAVAKLAGLVRERVTRSVGRERPSFDGFDSNLFRARKMAELRGRLELLMEDAEEDDEGAWVPARGVS